MPYIFEFRRARQERTRVAVPLPCRECHGDGHIVTLEGAVAGLGRVAGYNSAGAPYPEEYTHTCDHCGGSGSEPCLYRCGRDASTEGLDGPVCAVCAALGE